LFALVVVVVAGVAIPLFLRLLFPVAAVAVVLR
jgi:hypothetical protein